MTHALRRAALRAGFGLFVAAQLGFAGSAASGSHRHAWDPAGDAACWICLVMSLTSAAAVLGAVWAESR